MEDTSIVRFREYSPVVLATVEASQLATQTIVAEFGAQLIAVARAAPGMNLLLDLHRVDHLSSGAITEMLKVKEVLARSGGSVRLCGAHSHVREVFEITGLLDQFHVDGHVKKALIAYVMDLRREASAP